MDYEKAYKAVLQTATQWIKDGCTDKEKICLECVFPELRESESEDERIRKWLADYFSSIKETVWIHRDITCGQILAWLEKQKENPKNADSIPEDCVSLAKCEDRDSKYGVFPEDVIVVARACEKLEAHGYPELAHALKNVNLYTKEPKPVEKQDYSGLNELERAIHRGFLVAGVENVPVTIIKETAQDCLAHMPAWSEEDEMMRQGCIDSIKYELLDNGMDDEVETDPRIAWLKSLRPSWKPTEEQMNALNFAITYMFSTKANPTVLRDLYDDLLKLKDQ